VNQKSADIVLNKEETKIKPLEEIKLESPALKIYEEFRLCDDEDSCDQVSFDE
jgi:hypothetical protein